LLQPANAHASSKGLTRQFKAMTSVDKNREHTLVEEPLGNKFDEKRYTRDSKQVPCHLLIIDSSVLYQPPALQYRLVIQTLYGLKMNWVVCWVRLQFLSSARMSRSVPWPNPNGAGDATETCFIYNAVTPKSG
jgi:hypothetical protein